MYDVVVTLRADCIRLYRTVLSVIFRMTSSYGLDGHSPLPVRLTAETSA